MAGSLSIIIGWNLGLKHLDLYELGYAKWESIESPSQRMPWESP